MSPQEPISYIPYDDIVQESLRSVVRLVLKPIESNQDLLGDHHFYISFKTRFAGVSIPPHLLARHPEEITIVLQNKFWDLKVFETWFEVTLTFGGISSKLVIPFAAITHFRDPSVEFDLLFYVPSAEDAKEAPPPEAAPSAPLVVSEEGSNILTVDFKRKK
jgi:uncharacterized protein